MHLQTIRKTYKYRNNFSLTNPPVG